MQRELHMHVCRVFAFAEFLYSNMKAVPMKLARFPNRQQGATLPVAERLVRVQEMA